MMLSVENLTVAYGRIEALHGISFHVEEGEIVTLIGANGAGKSTTLTAISRLIPAESGVITYQGEDLLQHKPHDVVSKLGIAHVPEGRRIFGNLTVLENLRLAAWSTPKEEVENDLQRVFDIFPRLAERKRQLGDTLSGGEQQMLAVGRALMTHARLMLLDEPSMGLAPVLMQELFYVLREINRQGTTILLVEQNANMALKLANRGYVLETGTITLEGTSEELASDPSVKAAYLGG